MRPNIKRSAQVASIVLVLSVALTACGGGGSGVNLASASTGCGTGQPTIEPNTPTIAVLGEVGPKLSFYDQDISTVLTASQSMKAHLIINGVTGGTNAPDLLSNVVMIGEGNNNLLRTSNLTCKTKRVNQSFVSLKSGTPTTRPDTFDALNTLAGNLNNNPSKAPVDVALLTSLSANGGGVDLSDPATLAKPVQAINKLSAEGLIPSCKNWRISAVSPATGLSDVQAAQLKAFWLLYVSKCGGQLVAWTDHLATFPVSGSVASADTSQITIQRTPKEVTATLGSDLLFESDSATLQKNAAPTLGRLLELTKQYSGKIVVTGYVNPVGSGNTAGDRALSVQRAMAVKAWLAARHVSPGRISTVGMGSANPVYPGPRTAAQSAANRRVVVVIYTKGP